MKTRAAVDCGTNSTRLLVVDDRGEPLAREMRITRLGAGVDVNRRLDKAAIRRTLTALSSFRETLDEHGVEHVRVVATSAVRDAANRDELLVAASDILGVDVEMLSGQEEGRLTYQGATADLSSGALVLDIGGGSTELVVEDKTMSLDMGCVRLTEQCFRSDPPSQGELERAVATVRQLLQRAKSELVSETTLIAVAGTATSLAALDLGLDIYDPSRVHRHVLTRKSVEDLFERLTKQTIAER